MMWTRSMCVAVMRLVTFLGIFLGMGLGLAPSAQAAERSGLVRRASCTVVRYYVAKYSAPAAEAWARSKGATDAEIEAARHCLKDTPAPTLQAAAQMGG